MEIVLLIIIFMVLLVVIPLMMNKNAVMQVIKRLRQHQALDIQSAKTVEEIGLQPLSLRERMLRFRDYKPAALQGLIRTNIVQTTEDGRVYLSEEHLRNSRLGNV